jgi:hypothetical protein
MDMSARSVSLVGFLRRCSIIGQQLDNVYDVTLVRDMIQQLRSWKKESKVEVIWWVQLSHQ